MQRRRGVPLPTSIQPGRANPRRRCARLSAEFPVPTKEIYPPSALKPRQKANGTRIKPCAKGFGALAGYLAWPSSVIFAR
jgi:hypothetical protein